MGTPEILGPALAGLDVETAELTGELGTEVVEGIADVTETELDTEEAADETKAEVDKVVPMVVPSPGVGLEVTLGAMEELAELSSDAFT